MTTATASGILVDRSALLNALTAVSAAIPSRSPKPVLMNAYLRLDPDGSEVIGSDLEVAVRHRLDGVNVEAPTRLLLAPGRLRSILSTSDDDEISLSATDDKVTIRTRRAEFNLPTEDPELFPAPPEFRATAYHVVKAADLRRLIRRTVANCDPESVRYALGGCLWECLPDTMTMVGTDGRRLAKQTVPCETEGEPTIAESPVVPARALKLIDRALDDDDAPVHVAVESGKSVLIRTESATIYSRLVEGRFPAYQSVIPSEHEARIPFSEVLELRLAIEQAAIVTSEASRGVDFRISSGMLRLSTQAADVGQSQIELPIAYEGKTLEFTADPRYCLDVLKALDDDAALTLDVIDEKNPVVFQVPDGGVFVVMPLTRDR